MDWDNLLSQERLFHPNCSEHPNRPAYAKDLDRVVFSLPFRRLANKTQVHPLYENDHIHHRLIHSVETGSVGRSLGILVGHWLEEEGLRKPGQKDVISGIVQSACLAHDIGNPPFGHSGESAIGEWFKEQFDSNHGIFEDFDPSLKPEFEKFEGNAQGFRIISRLEMYRNEGGMRLTNSVLGAFSKYPTTAAVHAQFPKDHYCGTKKFGIFNSDLENFTCIAESLGLKLEDSSAGPWWRRHPLVFLVEAADDICYRVLDIEDAFACGDLSFESVAKCLQPLAGASNQDMRDKTQEEQISYMRARGIGYSIESCVEAFKNSYAAIMDGSFSQSLVEISSKANDFAIIRELTENRIFTAQRKTELEVSGRNIVHRILNAIRPVYDDLQHVNWKPSNLKSYNSQLARALSLDLRDVNSAYSALHSLADFVSGMTDRYAVKTARLLSGT